MKRGAAADLAFTAAAAMLAGATDIFGLRLLGDKFVSFMSGNSTMLGKALGTGDLAGAGPLATLVGLFVAGAAAGAAVAGLAGRRRAPAIGLLVTALLLVAWLWPAAEVPAMVLAMGALNNALTQVGSVAVGLTYVTGTLAKFGQGLGRTLVGKGDGTGWLVHAPIWLSLLAGAVGAAAFEQAYGSSPWPLPLFAAVLTLAEAARR